MYIKLLLIFYSIKNLTIMPIALMRKVSLLFMAILGFCTYSLAQNVSGTVVDKNGVPVAGVSVTVKKSSKGTATDDKGMYSLSDVPAGTVVVFSSAGYAPQEVKVPADGKLNITIQAGVNNLEDVVVVGYGTARKKDLTGSVATVASKDFNKGVQISADNLIQGKVAGVQVINNSGAPGGGVTVRIRGASSIRGNNTPLFVIDGVPLDNRSSRPGLAAGASNDINTSPGDNPLNFINPADIASMDVLKDASATAIYGSRGANGVVIITTKKGQSGLPKIDFSTSFGFSSIAKKLKVLNGDQYRKALADYGQPAGNDKGSNVDAMDAISRTGFVQNYNVAVSGGNENARFRLSLGYLDQQGIIKKTEYKKYNAGISGNFKFLDSKKLGLDINIITSHISEQIAPITNDAGAKGSLIGMALQWNPTKSFYKGDSVLNVDKGGDQINPVAYQEAYNDRAKLTTALASISPYFKFSKSLEYRMLVSINYSTGVRKTEVKNFINLDGIQQDLGASTPFKGGWAAVGESQLTTKQITQTLTYIKDINSNLSLNALLGYEFMQFNNSGSNQSAKEFDTYEGIPYYDYLQFSNPATRRTTSYNDPTNELQSFFGRANLNISGKYLLTATVRADGSSKFGKNNRYGIFPSFAGAWNLSKENFMADMRHISDVKLRLGWGQTGNQEFPAGASQETYAFDNAGAIRRLTLPNPDLKWETTTTTNIGVDFTISKRVTASIDYFKRETKDLIYPTDIADPQPPGTAITWKNIPGKIINKGLELSINSNIIDKKDFDFVLATNVTFLNNKLTDFPFVINTGAINGQGLSGAFSQLLTNDQPLNVFYLRRFLGINPNTKIADYQDGDAKFLSGSPNPKMLLGISATARYKKLSLELNMNGAFGHYVYNNTANAVVSLNNLKSDRNVATSLIGGNTGESLANPTSASTRYLEKGDYLKMANATLSYRIGNIARVVRNANVFVTGQNLFVITKYSGFDPEVNTNKPINSVPSFGIEYTPYPTSRTVTLGINFSL